MRRAALCLSAFIGVVSSRPVLAQNAAGEPTVDIQLFHPTAGGTNFLSTESGNVNPHLMISTGLHINYARSPLEVRVISSTGDQRDVGAVVKNRIDLSLLGAVGLFDIGEIGLSLPLITQSGLDNNALNNANINVGIQSLPGFSQGDLRIIPKVRVLNYQDGLASLAIVPTVVLPTAGQAEYAGEKGVVLSPSIAFSSNVGPFRAGMNLGYTFRERSQIQTLVIDDELFYKFAGAFDLLMGKGDNPLEVVAELHGKVPLQDGAGVGVDPSIADEFDKARKPLEFDIGVRIPLGSLLLTAGGGGGLLPGYGAPAPRVFVGLSYLSGSTKAVDTDEDGVPDFQDQCPDRKEDVDTFEDGDGCPDIDNDEDGVLDEDDQCPLAAEDRDEYNDEDGCPEPDNDEDGFLDADDTCPVDAEDKDDFEDSDGCPDPDNDKDEVLDVDDACPMEAEDKDGFKDFDGCPEPDNDGDGLADLNDLCPNHAEDKDNVADDDGCPEDNDGDGIADEVDKCPNKAEIYNGIEDEDGCPEKLKKKSLVEVTEEKIEIKEKVFFRSGRSTILKKSFNLLDQVASVLKNFKHLTKVRIEGHTDSRGSKRRNRRLSEQRAEAVKKYLVGKGIAIERLEAIGHGPDKPVASNRTRKGREQNRRVEFVIAEQKPIGVDVAEEARKEEEAKKAAEPEIEMNLELEMPSAPEAPPQTEEAPLLEIGDDPPESKGTEEPKKEEKKESEPEIEINLDI